MQTKQRSRRGSRRLVLASLVILGTGMATARADQPPPSTDKLPVSDLSGQIMIKQSFQHDTNPLLQASGQKSLSGSVTSPELIVNGDDPTHHADLDNRVDINKFNLTGFSSNDLHSSGHLNFTGETWKAGLAGNFDYDTTRTSEVTASGINIAGIRHTGFGVQPQTSVALSPLDQAQMGASYQRNRYDNLKYYTNYEVYGLTPGFQHAFTPLDNGIVQLQAGRYQTLTGPSITIDNVGPTVGWDKRLSERLTASANVGGQEMMFHYGSGSTTGDTSSFGYTFAVSLNFQGQQDTVQLSANRLPSPNANGSESETTTFSLNEIHLVTPRLELDLLTSYQLYDYSGGAAQSGVQNTYFNAAPKLLYHLTESLSTDLTYQYRRRDVSAGSSAQSNALMLNLIYKPVPETLAW